jgi:hypothetical protein
MENPLVQFPPKMHGVLSTVASAFTSCDSDMGKMLPELILEDTLPIDVGMPSSVRL